MRAKKSLRRRALTGQASTTALAALEFLDADWKEDQREVRWRQTVTELARFRDQHGHLPRRFATDGEEKRLYNWLANRRGEHRGRGNGSIKFARDNRAAYLNTHLPGWLESTHGTRWEDVITRLSVFRATHGRNPKVNADDDDESFLARWLVRQRRRLARGETLPDADRAALDAAAPYWDAPGLEAFAATAAELAGFLTEQARWPMERRGAPAEEIRLRRWLLGIRRVAAEATADSVWVTQRRAALLDDVIPGWSEPGA